MMHRIEFHAMGCRMLAVADVDPQPPALNEVPAWFDEWEQTLSRFRSDSELCQLNINDGNMVSVSQTLWDVFQASLEADRITGGLVNPLIYDALIHAGYDRSFDSLLKNDSRFVLDDGAATVSLAEIATDISARSICLPHGTHLDFGGVAKGWAAHRAMERLKVAGPALVNAGGDVAVSGLQADGERWSIGIIDPFNPDDYMGMLYVGAGGVATSGKDYRRWTRGGILQHHIIDPRTGLPAETDVLAATVIAPTVMEAEALAKMVVIVGSRAGFDRLNSDSSLSGLIVLENGERLYTSNYKDFFS
jgi:thiamine biosynthesis lipoprotein